jgi:hypothetical protein
MLKDLLSQELKLLQRDHLIPLHFLQFNQAKKRLLMELFQKL